jgi:hypothetical protein
MRSPGVRDDPFVGDFPHRRHFRSRAVAVCLVPLAGILLLFSGFCRAPFDDPGEGMHAEIAREILQTDEWVTLHLNDAMICLWPALLAAR